MTHPSTEIQEHHRRLYRLLKGQSYTYYNSGQRRIGEVMVKAMELYDKGMVELKQKKTDDGTFDYIATGLLTENRMRKVRDRE